MTWAWIIGIVLAVALAGAIGFFTLVWLAHGGGR